ncbi:helix-turn-helix domain-containing protein [Undibacterium umbellatum]|uniref:Helix-turn-helix transcriptional regulator n=1 Tax=Undibacterium umbellatum TaxID=2762300 RepID=A0ABR6ZIV0_9BURK|nr:helix-turn-helix transcriptional regulator [Undibacterium umbellatum]MBC3911531.1 helix-turn-helix transcriptional regulator [Undibacterium umbellatum]
MASIVLQVTVQDMAAFAERLKTLRESRKLTQTRLAELIGANSRAYNRWERGNFIPQLDTLMKIADVLNVTLDELTGRTTTTHEPVVHNPKLYALLQEVDSLPDVDQQALIILMDSLVKRAKMDRVLAA